MYPAPTSTNPHARRTNRNVNNNVNGGRGGAAAQPSRRVSNPHGTYGAHPAPHQPQQRQSDSSSYNDGGGYDGRDGRGSTAQGPGPTQGHQPGGGGAPVVSQGAYHMVVPKPEKREQVMRQRMAADEALRAMKERPAAYTTSTGRLGGTPKSLAEVRREQQQKLLGAPVRKALERKEREQIARSEREKEFTEKKAKARAIAEKQAARNAALPSYGERARQVNLISFDDSFDDCRDRDHDTLVGSTNVDYGGQSHAAVDAGFDFEDEQLRCALEDSLNMPQALPPDHSYHHQLQESPSHLLPSSKRGASNATTSRVPRKVVKQSVPVKSTAQTKSQFGADAQSNSTAISSSPVRSITRPSAFNPPPLRSTRHQASPVRGNILGGGSISSVDEYDSSRDPDAPHFSRRADRPTREMLARQADFFERQAAVANRDLLQ